MSERELPDGTLHCSQIYKAAKHIVCKMSTTEKKLALLCFLADLESSQACSLQNKRRHPGKEAKHHKPPLPVAPFLQWEKVHRSSCSMIFYLLSASCSTSSCIHLLQLWSFFLLQKSLTTIRYKSSYLYCEPLVLQKEASSSMVGRLVCYKFLLIRDLHVRCIREEGHIGVHAVQSTPDAIQHNEEESKRDG
jgi:hypothetical protein